ncbi:methanogen output domain 1-containing protein [Pseudosulfitobacter koreensis]|uniref:Methanogen output domain 1-containing protein n=1 Tax=Pseudosulfitobacter koreensis TaxID=2968472 RepID=A0ABT1Z2N6_9RHOB|nr:methanogen output domain 1-containing protein [Pseudosulfitobacter koreense]MCR8827378.1 methanogen output domain 1-containing protein [Pseudosulfitobacter koreense]
MTDALPQPLRTPAIQKDYFLRSILRELVGMLEQTVGEREAEAYVNHVGISMGRILNEDYRTAFGSDKLDARQVAATLVDLKARIDGGFSITEIDSDKIVLENTACPFGDKVVGRPSLCRMTANVFGHITAENLGYARVRIDKAIARGDPGCRVVIALSKADETSGPGESEFFVGTI